MDREPRSGVRAKKSSRDRLIRLAKAHSGWVLGFLDETRMNPPDSSGWSRLSRPRLQAWAEEGQPLRLVEQSVAKGDTDAKALSCYGLLGHWQEGEQTSRQALWLRFVEGRPVSELTVAFLEASCVKVAALGKSVLALIWDNAGWHKSTLVRGWLKEHNRRVKQTGKGVRILLCPLPVKSPWLNPIEAHWRHGKRQVAEPGRLLSCQEMEQRICAYFGCQPEPHLAVAKDAA